MVHFADDAGSALSAELQAAVAAEGKLGVDPAGRTAAERSADQQDHTLPTPHAEPTTLLADSLLGEWPFQPKFAKDIRHIPMATLRERLHRSCIIILAAIVAMQGRGFNTLDPDDPANTQLIFAETHAFYVLVCDLLSKD